MKFVSGSGADSRQRNPFQFIASLSAMGVISCSAFRRRLFVSAAAAGLVFVLTAAAWACPTCKEALMQSDPHHQSMVAGYFYSILLMMSTPFVVAGSFASYAYWLIRRDRLQRQHGTERQSVGDQP
jgi:hypothetical protein